MMTFEILTIIVLLNVVATIELWRRAARRPEKLKRKFRKRLWDSDPITPKHQPPPPPKEGSDIRKEDLEFFSDFEDFANVVNWWLADEYNKSRWRLQELPYSTEHPRLAWGCRRYTVFYNQADVGKIEPSPG